MALNYGPDIEPGQYPALEEAVGLAQQRGLTGDLIEGELGPRHLVKAWFDLGPAITVTLCDMATTDAACEDGFQPSIGWDAYSAITSGSLRGGDADEVGGVAPTAAAALDGVIGWLVAQGYATVDDQGVATAADFCCCGHLISAHQTGDGPWTGFCGARECGCEEPTSVDVCDDCGRPFPDHNPLIEH